MTIFVDNEAYVKRRNRNGREPFELMEPARWGVD